MSDETLADLIEKGNLDGDMKVELLGGERESIYWSRLPEKVGQPISVQITDKYFR
jgi:hypothetical protein